MTQQEQQEFMERLEVALSWMRAIQERLKANDNTQGPRDALEARLRETEKIHQSEHEGRVKMDMALVAAENLLQSADEDLRNRTHAKLKDLKSLWEETCMYIVHCHSRIEWVWLHWSEYLKAYEEFEMWLTKQQRSLDVQVELQVGVKEKLWQVDQQRVVVSDIHGQAVLLERLLDEAAALHNRTQDPGVEPQAQERLQEAYNDVRDRAEERLSLLQKVADEHQMYQGCVQRFQSWLLSKTKELTDLMEREDPGENKFKALQALDDVVASEEKTLQHIEGVAEAVRGTTSPAGAEMVVEEAEELRLGWQRLRQGLCEAEEGLRSSLDSHSQYMARCQRLGEDIGRLRVLLHGLDQELAEGCETRDYTEEQMVGQWRKYTGVRNTLAGEESQVELLKAQLKELFRFSEDSRHLSDDVLAVVKEHQSVKCRATRLCSESESGLRSILQDPVLVYTQWSHMVSQVLEVSAEVTDFSNVAMLVQSIEHLLKESFQLQERFSLLQVKGDLLESVFGPERSDGLQGELSAAIKTRELLHAQLLQRRSRLQGLISRTKDFSDTYDMIRSKLAALQARLLEADGLQPDILAKKSQSDQFRVIQKDLEDCEADITALETLVSSSQSNKTQFEKLYADWKHLNKAVGVKVNESEESIADHENFHDNLLNIEKWLMIMKQKLESFHSPSGDWTIDGRQNEAERVLGEFPEKEIQLQQMEAQGQGVLERTSDEGQVHITRDMKRLRESWLHTAKITKEWLRNNSVTVLDWPSQSPDRNPIEHLWRDLKMDVHQRSPSNLTELERICKEEWQRIPKSRCEKLVASFPRRLMAVLAQKGHYKSRRREFEAWLHKENEVLSKIFSTKGATLSAKEHKIQQNTLKVLRAGVSRGQEQFQLLLQESSEAGSEPAEDVDLEDLRYRWMLYKSKLKNVGDRTSAKVRGELVMIVKTKPGLLQRVCRLALLLWLLLLALLLMAFLLPLMDENNSCSLSNNFARSFSIMLRYDGPPPT
uniref:Spectrin repeat containing, nuclear envelope family member 3 n=1 Tax=Mastacembelus armatus TaxID=205130 RepID=A0A7N8X4M4_9TELE